MKYYKIKNWTLFTIIFFSFSIFSGFFLKNVYELQFVNQEYFQEQALSYRIKSETLKAKRGTIYDQNLIPIATSTQSFNVGIYPQKISNIKEISVLFCLIDESQHQLSSRLTSYPCGYCNLIQSLNRRYY